jgi:O-antigen/teichoic acid export membrane protein
MRINSFADIKSVLLNNKTAKQTIIKNTFWISIAHGISKLLKLVLIIYVARILGATEYGKFAFALSFVALFKAFSDLGLADIITREFAKRKRKKEEFYSLLSLRIVLSLAMLFFIIVGSFLITDSPDIRKVILVLALFSSVDSFSIIIKALFKARQKIEYESWGIILESLVVTIVGFYILFFFPSVLNLAYSYFISVLVSLFFMLTIFSLKFFPLKFLWNKDIWIKYLKTSWPLALAALFSMIYVSIDSVMMGYLNQITETGWYNAAYKIAVATGILMTIINASFYPALSSFFRKSRKNLQKLWNYQVEIMVISSIPLMVGGYVLAPKIINFFYGEGFNPSILSLQILMVMSGIIYLSMPFHRILIISNHQDKFFWITLFGAIINIVLNFILIPTFSLYGAAVATVITYFIVFCLFIWFTYKYRLVKVFNRRFALISFISVISSALMFIILSSPFIYDLNIFFSFTIGFLTYIFILFSLKKAANPILKKYS